MRVLPLLLMACASPTRAPLDTTEQGGERLSLLRMEGSAQPGHTLALYDNERGMACRFVEVAGELRCMPLAVPSWCETPQGTRQWYVPSDCPDLDGLAIHTDDGVFAAQPAESRCLDDSEHATYFVRGARLDPTDYARGTASRSEGGSGLGVASIVSEGGARILDGLLFEGEACEPRRFVDGSTRCAPRWVERGFWFADPECTLSTAIELSPVPPGTWILDVGPTGADLDAAISMESSVAVEEVWSNESGICVATAFPGLHIIPHGERIDARVLPEVLTVPQPEGSPALWGYAGPDGLRQVQLRERPQWSISHEDRTECVPAMAPDGALLCRPRFLSISTSGPPAATDPDCLDIVDPVFLTTTEAVTRFRHTMTCPTTGTQSVIEEAWRFQEEVPWEEVAYQPTEQGCLPLEPEPAGLGLSWARREAMPVTELGPRLQIHHR